MLGKEARENLKQLVTLQGPQSEESNGCGFVPSVTIRFHLQFSDDLPTSMNTNKSILRDISPRRVKAWSFDSENPSCGGGHREGETLSSSPHCGPFVSAQNWAAAS